MTKKLHNVFLLFSVLFITVVSVSANNKVSPDGIWKEIDDSELKRRPVERLVEPDIYKTFRLDKTILNGFLKNAPLEFSAQSRNNANGFDFAAAGRNIFAFRHQGISANGRRFGGQVSES